MSHLHEVSLETRVRSSGQGKKTKRFNQTSAKDFLSAEDFMSSSRS